MAFRGSTHIIDVGARMSGSTTYGVAIA